MSQVIIIKLPTGSNPPAGFQLVKTLRGIDIYHKTIQKINANDINDLNNMFNNLGIDSANNVAIVPEVDENAFIESLQNLSMGGKRRSRSKKSRSRKSKKSKKSRKSRKY
jgi:histidyl-tRNA synthetase